MQNDGALFSPLPPVSSPLSPPLLSLSLLLLLFPSPSSSSTFPLPPPPPLPLSLLLLFPRLLSECGGVEALVQLLKDSEAMCRGDAACCIVTMATDGKYRCKNKEGDANPPLHLSQRSKKPCIWVKGQRSLAFGSK